MTASRPRDPMARAPGVARVAALVAAIAVAPGATAQPAAEGTRSARKTTPDRFTQAAGEAFAAAMRADQAGDLRTALGLYQKAYAISPHPNTAYNLADVHRRLLELPAAIEAYETYLALLPGASDRREVEALLERLSRAPGTLLIETGGPSDPRSIDLRTAYVIVDGEIKIRPGTAPAPFAEDQQRTGLTVRVSPGPHVVDVITPLTFTSERCAVAAGGSTRCGVRAPPRIDGRLITTTSHRDLVVRLEPQQPSIVGKRVEAPPGRRALLVRDRSYECRPIAIDLAPGGDALHVFVETREYEVERCRALAVKQSRLVFAP